MPTARPSRSAAVTWPASSAATAEAISGERTVGINIDGTEHALEPGDISLTMVPLEGYQVESEAGHAVGLALELDKELRREGLAREVVHAVQNARKAAELAVDDRIELTLGGDAELLDAARAFDQYVAGETLAVAINYVGALVGDRRRERLAGDVALVRAGGVEQLRVAAERQRDAVLDGEAGALARVLHGVDDLASQTAAAQLVVERQVERHGV